MEKPDYITFLSPGKMEIHIDSPIPCYRSMRLGACAGIAGRRFAEDKDGEMVITDYGLSRAEEAKDSMIQELTFFIERLDKLQSMVHEYDEYMMDADKRIKEAQKHKGECKIKFKAGKMSESEYKDVLQTVRPIYDAPLQEYNCLFHRYFPEIKESFPTISISFARHIISMTSSSEAHR